MWSGASGSSVSWEHDQSRWLHLRRVWEPHSWRSKVKVRHYFQEWLLVYVLPLHVQTVQIPSWDLVCISYFHSHSSPLVQFQLLHSKFHLCSVPTRALILSTYVKFINLFPEIKPQIQQILSSDSQSRNGSQELQQRAIEYLQLTTIATPDVLVSKKFRWKINLRFSNFFQEMFPRKSHVIIKVTWKSHVGNVHHVGMMYIDGYTQQLTFGDFAYMSYVHKWTFWTFMWYASTIWLLSYITHICL